MKWSRKCMWHKRRLGAFWVRKEKLNTTAWVNGVFISAFATLIENNVIVEKRVYTYCIVIVGVVVVELSWGT